MLIEPCRKVFAAGAVPVPRKSLGNLVDGHLFAFNQIRPKLTGHGLERDGVGALELPVNPVAEFEEGFER